jgi:hypothetical protein
VSQICFTGITKSMMPVIKQHCRIHILLVNGNACKFFAATGSQYTHRQCPQHAKLLWRLYEASWWFYCSITKLHCVTWFQKSNIMIEFTYDWLVARQGAVLWWQGLRTPTGHVHRHRSSGGSVMELQGREQFCGDRVSEPPQAMCTCTVVLVVVWWK